ncbi:MAG: hypothetical protein JXB62_20810 [Pirellulales bacterium]|nr:hypothetical protein [Pirellulales bacterium]
MKSEKANAAQDVMIARHHWDVPVRVGLQPYVQFVHRLDAELEKLVAKWAHTAAPNTMALRRIRR